VQSDYNLISKGHVHLDPYTSQLSINHRKYIVPTSPKKLIVRNIPWMRMDYNVIEDMKKTKENVSIFNIYVIFLNKEALFFKLLRHI